jgi:citrate/tricarballylate utilization protein
MAEGERIMRICNSCRYCEGYCAVFPAMEKRQSFAAGDLNYLANLCHNCSECYYACQYAPPHEFAVDVPKLLTEIRARSYRQYAWPGALARGTFVCLVIAAGLILSIHSVLSHGVLVGLFGGVSLFVLIAFAVGFARFWRDSRERLADFFNPGALATAFRDVLTLHYLDGGGGGCSYPTEQQSQSRRWLHHLTFYGFGLCFASTVTAAFYHYALGWKAPYGYFSVPVVLGTVGGLALVAGTGGLLWQKRTAFSALLFLAGSSGLLLLALRETTAMGYLLIVHLAIILALFLTLPYGTFVHAIYRSAALVKYALERSRGA